MTIHRPTIGATVALGLFRPEGMIGYAAVYPDGALGPICPTRAEAETAATIPCRSCGSPVYPADLYCDKCGAKVCGSCHGTGYVLGAYGDDVDPCYHCEDTDANAVAVDGQA